MNTSTDCDTHDLLNCDCDIENRASGSEHAEDSIVRHCQLGVPSKHKVSVRILGHHMSSIMRNPVLQVVLPGKIQTSLLSYSN